MGSPRSGSRVPVAPLAALFTLAVLAIAWVASAHVCARPIVVSMSGASMPGMDMGSMPMATAQTPFGTVTICPVVLGLIALSTLLAAWAIVTGWRDRHRALTLTVLARTLARLPVLRTFVARKGWRETEQVLRWCFEGTPSAFRFVYARLGQMVEAPARGTLRAEATLNNIQHGNVSYIDVADALVLLASDEERTWERKALFFNYANAEVARPQ